MDAHIGPTTTAVGAALFAASPDGIIVGDRSGRIVLANDVAAALFRTSVDDLVGRPVEELLPSELRSGHEAHRERFHASPATRSMGADLALTAQRADGSTFPVDIALSPLTLDGEELVLASIRNIAERQFAERELRVARSRLATLEDRERIARDLHDTVIQELFGAGLGLEGVAARVDEHAAQQLRGTIERLDATITQLREVIFDLRHPAGGGLFDQISDVINAAREEIGAEPRLRVHGADLASLPDDVATHLVPTLREALTNVAKHASASDVAVDLLIADSVVLTITDNGVGLGDDHIGGFGLSNIEERAELLGGSLALEQPERGGTRLIWRAPLTRA